MYTIIGDGRLAKHFIFYFTHKNIPFKQWHRGTAIELIECLKQSTHVLILITDSAIEPFIQTHQNLLKHQQLIHCSGALISNFAHTAHPFMTFSSQTYDLADYSKIPFVLEQEGPRFAELFPKLENPHYYIPRDTKPYYHALCVMANNFTTILWQKFFNETANKFNFPADFAFPILKQTLNNLINAPMNSLTGPFARKDLKTIHANLNALAQDDFQNIYQAFTDTLLNSEEITS